MLASPLLEPWSSALLLFPYIKGVGFLDQIPNPLGQLVWGLPPLSPDVPERLPGFGLHQVPLIMLILVKESILQLVVGVHRGGVKPIHIFVLLPPPNP